jgi:arylsulfatase A-like enzyme
MEPDDGSGDDRPDSPPNIVLIFSDEHRHDALGCAGNPVVSTPNLDGLSSRGVRFSRMWCQSPICQPSRASLITGRYPNQHGIVRNLSDDLDPEWDTMMKRLQARGYVTATVGKTHYFTPAKPPEGTVIDMRSFEGLVKRFGWDHVVEEYDRYYHVVGFLDTPYMEYLRTRGRLEPYQEQVRSVFRRTPHHWDGITSCLPKEDDLTSFLTRAAIEFVRQHDGRSPFLLKVAYVQPHVPLMDDPVWAEHYSGVDIPLGPRTPVAPTNEVWADYVDRMQHHSNSDLLTDDYLSEAGRHYYGMISLIDECIGQIVATINEQGFGENTWFIYTSDHGELLGDHNLMGKTCFYRSSVQVPAIVRPPFSMQGRVTDDAVELVDVTATITDIAGAEPVAGCMGRSLLPAVTGAAVGRDAMVSVISARAPSLFVGVADERYRYTTEVSSGTPCELFDLLHDPDELENLVTEPATASIQARFESDYVKPLLDTHQLA